MRTAGGIGSANADMSNDKGGERPPRRKTKGSCAENVTGLKPYTETAGMLACGSRAFCKSVKGDPRGLLEISEVRMLT